MVSVVYITFTRNDDNHVVFVSLISEEKKHVTNDQSTCRFYGEMSVYMKNWIPIREFSS